MVQVYEKNVAKTTNPNYLVRIDSTAGFRIIADMPEELALTFSSSFEPRFPASLASYNPLADTAGNWAGESLLWQDNTIMMWKDTQPIEIPLTLQFDAYSSAYEDVFFPMRTIEMMALPDVNGGFLTSPAPSFTNPYRNRISMWLGRMMFFDSVLITSVSSNYDSKMDAQGYPISGILNITFSTTKVFGKQDWLGTAGRPNL